MSTSEQDPVRIHRFNEPGQLRNVIGVQHTFREEQRVIDVATSL